MTSTPLTLSFAKHTFANDKEVALANSFTRLQRCAIENTLIDVVHEKLHLDGSLPDTALKHEYLRGQLAILEWLLAVDTQFTTGSNS
jgi:hypothetical protein